MTTGYEIELLGFPDVPPDEAVRELTRVFRIPADKAQRLLARAPVRVMAASPRRQAEKTVKALLSIGADVRVRGSGAQRVYRAHDGAATSGSWTGASAAVFGHHPRVPGAVAQAVDSAKGETTICPKCGFEQPPDESCARCGVVFAKFEPRQVGGSSRETSAAGPMPGRRASRSGSAGSSAQTYAYLVSPDDADGFFRSTTPAFDPALLMRAVGVQAGPLRGASSVAPPGTFASEALRLPTGRAAEMTRGSADVGFWDKLGVAFALNVRGKSHQWLALMAVLGALSWLSLYIPQRVPVFYLTILGLFLFFTFFSAFLSAQWRFFHAAFYQGITDRNEPHGPVTELGDFKSEFVLPGQILSLGAIVLWAPFFFTVGKAISDGVVPPGQRLLLFSLIPLVYWPMAMAHVSATGRLTEIFIVTGVVKGMAIGGLEYCFVVALGVVAFFGAGLLAGGADEVQVWVWALLYSLLGYVSGVQGYLLGRLLRRRPRMIGGTIVEEAPGQSV